MRLVDEAFTPYADLDQLLLELTVHWRRILGESFAGASGGSTPPGNGDILARWGSGR